MRKAVQIACFGWVDIPKLSRLLPDFTIRFQYFRSTFVSKKIFERNLGCSLSQIDGASLKGSFDFLRDGLRSITGDDFGKEFHPGSTF